MSETSKDTSEYKKDLFYKKKHEKSKFKNVTNIFGLSNVKPFFFFEKTQWLETPTISLAYIKIDAIVKYQSSQGLRV